MLFRSRPPLCLGGVAEAQVCELRHCLDPYRRCTDLVAARNKADTSSPRNQDSEREPDRNGTPAPDALRDVESNDRNATVAPVLTQQRSARGGRIALNTTEGAHGPAGSADSGQAALDTGPASLR